MRWPEFCTFRDEKRVDANWASQCFFATVIVPAMTGRPSFGSSRRLAQYGALHRFLHGPSGVQEYSQRQQQQEYRPFGQDRMVDQRAIIAVPSAPSSRSGRQRSVVVRAI
jgi:hypothetical protein